MKFKAAIALLLAWILTGSLLASCAKAPESKTAPQSPEPSITSSVKSTVRPSASHSTEASKPAPAPVTSSSFSSAFAYNRKLASLYQGYHKLMNGLNGYEGDSGSDYDIFSLIFHEYRQGTDGSKVGDFYIPSKKGTFSIGAGMGLEDEDLWYLTFTFEQSATDREMYFNTASLLLACQTLGLEFDGSKESDEVVDTLVSTLCYSETDVAVELKGIVMGVKILRGGQRLIMFNSLDFYNSFYAGSIEEYIRLD